MDSTSTVEPSVLARGRKVHAALNHLTQYNLLPPCTILVEPTNVSLFFFASIAGELLIYKKRKYRKTMLYYVRFSNACTRQVSSHFPQGLIRRSQIISDIDPSIVEWIENKLESSKSFRDFERAFNGMFALTMIAAEVRTRLRSAEIFTLRNGFRLIGQRGPGIAWCSSK